MGATAALCGVALLCALGLGQRPAAMPSCGPGRFLDGQGTAARCCGPCAPGKARAGGVRDGPQWGPGSAAVGGGPRDPPRAFLWPRGGGAAGRGPDPCPGAWARREGRWDSRGVLCCPGEAPCPGRNCTCVQAEFHCGDPQCSTCKHHVCPPGQEAQPRGELGWRRDCGQ